MSTDLSIDLCLLIEPAITHRLSLALALLAALRLGEEAGTALRGGGEDSVNPLRPKARKSAAIMARSLTSATIFKGILRYACCATRR